VSARLDRAAVTALLDTYFGRPEAVGAVDWRGAFDGEAMLLTLEAGTHRIIRVEFADGVAQVAPPGPFDARACASALGGALDGSREAG
jgi:hypothetical protein